jgi:spore coat protein U domain-containing protein, fimbrial subunit CupE1/2/3/6
LSARTLLAASGAVIGSVLVIALPALASCTISTTGVSFGTYDVFASAPLDSTGSVTYRCSDTGPITVFLGKGGAATFNPRRMLKVSEALTYNLYLDASRTTIWGDGTGGSQAYSNSSPVKNQNITVTIYGRVPAGQDVTAGSYSNTITATINF